MKKTMIVMATLTVLTTLTACSRSGSRTYDADRSESAYRSAMSDYSAGRLDAARRSFEKAICANPLNASAHFQLACILQDVIGEPLAAYVEYMMFLRIDPGSDKSKIASERAQICLKSYHASFAKEMSGSEALSSKELLVVKKENAALHAKVTELVYNLEQTKNSLTNVADENARLRNLLNGLSRDNERPKDRMSFEMSLLNEDDDEPRRDMSTEWLEIAKIEAAQDASNSADVSILPKQSVDAKAKRDAKRQSESNAPNAAQKNVIPRPATYTIAEGDTLYRLAQRFYGRRSAWEMIRNANKEKISNDGKLRVGDVIKLP